MKNFHGPNQAQMNGVLLLGDRNAYEYHATTGVTPGSRRPESSAAGPASNLLPLLASFGFRWRGLESSNLMPLRLSRLFIKGLSLVEASRSWAHSINTCFTGIGIRPGEFWFSFWAVVGPCLLGLKPGDASFGWAFSVPIARIPSRVHGGVAHLVPQASRSQAVFEIGSSGPKTARAWPRAMEYAGSF